MQAEPFQSKRLKYEGIGPEDDDLLIAISSDGIARMNSFHGLPEPASKSSAKKDRDWLTTQLIAVKICLCNSSSAAPPSESPSGAIDDHETETSPRRARSTPDKSVAIGVISLSAAPPIFAHHRQSMIGVQILGDYRGNGYGSEAIEWILDYGFSLVGLHRITIGCFGWNHGAKRLYDRMGFVLEERNRKAMWFRGEWWDTYGWAMLEDEWRERRKDERVPLRLE